jgi:ATP-dependent Lhr-like helicase
VCLLDGFELAADAWERAILPARLERYEPAMLDMLCLAGEIGWGRLSAPTDEPRRGASFFNDLALACRLERADLRQAIGELVARGLAASDGFAGLRALIAANAPATSDRRTQFAGRWTATGRRDAPADARDRAIEVQAAGLLRRYGVLFRRLLAREANAAPWRDLVRVLRRLEARGEIRGGRFVSGMSGEQFARPDAVERLREVRRTRPDGRLIAISTADPLNLAGILTDGERVRAAGRNRILYRDGVPIAAREGDFLRQLVPIDPAEVSRIWRALRTVTQTSRVPGP